MGVEEIQRAIGNVQLLDSVHHLEKYVDGVPLRRPPWFFDVRVQGSGVVDIASARVIPEWSPDGQRLAYFDQVTANIGVMNADGSGATPLPTGSDVETDPRWSPDGRQILFRREITQPFSEEIWVMDADGTHQRKIPLSAFLSPFKAVWSPDGKFIALEASSGIWVVKSLLV